VERPLTWEPARDREPLRDLNREDFSAMPEAEPSEPPKVTARPPNREPVRETEPVRDLKKEAFSAKPEAEDSDPVKDLARPLA